MYEAVPHVPCGRCGTTDPAEFVYPGTDRICGLCLDALTLVTICERRPVLEYTTDLEVPMTDDHRPITDDADVTGVCAHCGLIGTLAERTNLCSRPDCKYGEREASDADRDERSTLGIEDSDVPGPHTGDGTDEDDLGPVTGIFHAAEPTFTSFHAQFETRGEFEARTAPTSDPHPLDAIRDAASDLGLHQLALDLHRDAHGCDANCTHNRTPEVPMPDYYDSTERCTHCFEHVPCREMSTSGAWICKSCDEFMMSVAGFDHDDQPGEIVSEFDPEGYSEFRRSREVAASKIKRIDVDAMTPIGLHLLRYASLQAQDLGERKLRFAYDAYAVRSNGYDDWNTERTYDPTYTMPYHEAIALGEDVIEVAALGGIILANCI